MSVTVNEICVGPPFIFPNGVTVTKQFGYEPVITTPETGMIAVFEDETVTFAEEHAIVESRSPIVNGNAAVGVSSLIV